MKTLLLFLIAVSVIFSCKKNDFIKSPDAVLSFSTDSLKFDTVFTSVGSVTKSFKIINNNKQKILADVKLIGGINSSFKTNIDGEATPQKTNLEIPAEDSIYVFVTLQINPTTQNLPFIVSDSISVKFNNNERFIQLEGFGQNANFLRNQTISSNTTWDNLLPYVILNGVKVAENATLTIESGTKIFFHANSPMLVDGTLLVNGQHSNPVIFSGDRLDEYYRDLPGSWPGIYFSESSKSNKMVFAEIKNPFVGISAISSNNNLTPQLILEQSKIYNAYDAGIQLTATFANVSNSLIYNCATNIKIREGGNYNFTFNTIASYSSQYLFRTNPVLSVYNFNDEQTVSQNLNANFTNCIFWGNGGLVENEVDVIKQGAGDFNVVFDHCIYKANSNPESITFIASLRNQDPNFELIDVINNDYDFHVSAGPVIDNGIEVPFSYDLDNNPRVVGLPDIGAYEKQ